MCLCVCVCVCVSVWLDAAESEEKQSRWINKSLHCPSVSVRMYQFSLWRRRHKHEHRRLVGRETVCERGHVREHSLFDWWANMGLNEGNCCGGLGFRFFWGMETYSRNVEGEPGFHLYVSLPLISRLFAGNAGGGAERCKTGVTGRPGDVHSPHRWSAGCPGGSGVERWEWHRKVSDSLRKLCSALMITYVRKNSTCHHSALHSSVQTAVESFTRKKDL